MKHDDTRTVFDALRRIVRDLRQSTDRDGTLGPARLFIMQLIAEHGPLGVAALGGLTHTALRRSRSWCATWSTPSCSRAGPTPPMDNATCSR